MIIGSVSWAYIVGTMCALFSQVREGEQGRKREREEGERVGEREEGESKGERKGEREREMGGRNSEK